MLKEKKMQKVKQFSNRHFILRDEQNKTTYFQSYDSLIVKIDETGKITLGKHWNQSVTTSKNRIRFLNESTKETQKKLDSGEYLYDENLV